MYPAEKFSSPAHQKGSTPSQVSLASTEEGFDAREICFVMAPLCTDIEAIRFVIAQKRLGVEAVFLVISPESGAIAPERVAGEENFFVAASLS